MSIVPGRKFSTRTSARSSSCVEQARDRRLLEIEREAFLVPVDAQEVGALLSEERRTPSTRVVAAPGLLDLDDPGAHVGEHHRAVRAGQHARQIDDGQAGERRVDRRSLETYNQRMIPDITVFSGSH